MVTNNLYGFHKMGYLQNNILHTHFCAVGVK